MAENYHTEDLDILLENVNEIPASGSPGILSVYGPDAFPIIAGSWYGTQVPLVAGARLGNGKILLYAHDGYLVPKDDQSQLKQFLLNNIKWASNGQTDKNVGIYSPYYYKDLAKVLTADGQTPEPLNFTQLNDEEFLQNFNVIFIQKVQDLKLEGVKAFKNFVQNGGGLIIGATAWAYNEDITKYPGNSLVSDAGLLWTTNSGITGSGPSGAFVTDRSNLKYANVFEAYDEIIGALQANDSSALSDDKIKRLSGLLDLLFSVLPENDEIFLPKAKDDIQELMKRVPYFDKDLPLQDPSLKCIVKLDCKLRTIPSVSLHLGEQPFAKNFPGSVGKDVPRVQDQLVEVDIVGKSAWYSTGLYAPPGAPIKVSITPSPNLATKSKLSIRIGTHKDDTSDHEGWCRCPLLSLTSNVAKINPGGVTELANSFGGLVYICSDNDEPLGHLEAKISGAVKAPYFVLGKTTNNEWNSTIKNYQTPWSELAGNYIILTLPTDAVRKVEDPESLMKLWDKIVATEDEFSNLARIRPERMCADIDIGGEGYMHSGYPFMIHKDEAIDTALSVENLSSGNDKCWGLFHELGHNHQETDWTFEGTGEVTNNVFDLYVMDTLFGHNAAKARPDVFEPTLLREDIQKYLAGGTNFDAWKDDPWLALKFYYQLYLNFGWDAFKRVFRAYQNLTKDERPKNNNEKMDKWLTMFSRTAGVNLSPLFVSWGFPVSQAAQDSLLDLPDTDQTINNLIN